MAIEILSKKVDISIYTELPPGFIDDIDLRHTRHLTVAPSWTLNWHKLTKYGLTRYYFDEMLKMIDPLRLRTINAPFSKSNFEILASFKNLTSLTADLKNITWESFAHELDLPKLQLINVSARGPFTPQLMEKITAKCKDLTSFAFPRHSTNWQTSDFLPILRETKIRRISSWDFRNNSFSSLISTLEQLPDLLDIEIYLKKHPSSEQHAEYDFDLLTGKLLRQKSLKRLAVFVCADITRAEIQNYTNRIDLSTLDLPLVLQNNQNIEELVLSSIIPYSSLFRAISKMHKLKKLMLIEMPIQNENFTEAFTNQSLCSITVQRPAELDFEGIEILIQSIYQMAKLNRLKDLTLSIVTEELADMDLLSVNDMIQTAVLALLEDLSDQLVRISFTGSWVNNDLIENMPKMSRLEALDLTPYDYFRAHRYTQEGIVQGYGYVANVALSTSTVLKYARTSCPALLEPRFLVHNSLFRQIPNESSGTIIPMNVADSFNKQLYQFLDEKDTLSSYERRKRYSQLRLSNDGVNYDHSFAEWKSYCENGLF